MAQFRCEICGEDFEQRSRYERHLATSHPPRAPSMADVARAVRGVDFPARRDVLVRHAIDSGAAVDVVALLEELPDWTFRDAAEVAKGLGERMASGRVHTAREAASAEAPSGRGGASAARGSTSAAAIATLLTGIRFPCSRAEIAKRAWANRDRVDDPEPALAAIRHLPDVRYRTMADVEHAVAVVRRTRTRAGRSGPSAGRRVR